MARSKSSVHHQERLAGCDERLHVFIREWEKRGEFPLTIPPEGGLREDEFAQGRLYAIGRTIAGKHAGKKGYPVMGLTVTNARSLLETPHGRGGALDVYPAILSKHGTVVAIYDEDRLKFQIVGEFAEKLNLQWGGRFESFFDGPHIQVPDWRELTVPERRFV